MSHLIVILIQTLLLISPPNKPDSPANKNPRTLLPSGPGIIQDMGPFPYTSVKLNVI